MSNKRLVLSGKPQLKENNYNFEKVYPNPRHRTNPNHMKSNSVISLHPAVAKAILKAGTTGHIKPVTGRKFMDAVQEVTKEQPVVKLVTQEKRVPLKTFKVKVGDKAKTYAVYSI
tara:strand:+ start:719 stop:1063 length:345 start_codon:yes stop_codon:yes gene_type:complete